MVGETPEGVDSGVRFDRKILASDRDWRASVSQAVVAKFPNVANSTAVLGIKHMAAALSNDLR